MAFSLFAPPTTNWNTERRRREAEAAGPYNRAAELTRRDAETAARGVALPGRGAAAARDMTQAVAPEIARIRAEQANAVGEVAGGVRRDMRAEIDQQNTFMNNLLGGLAGIAGQVGVPLISGMGGPGAGPQPPSPMMGAEAAATGAPPMAPGMAPMADPHGYANGGLYPLSEEERMRREEERRRREAAAAGGGGGLGGMMGAAAPIAGMANPLAGLALGAGSRLFG